jgi:hypothetical protein
MNTLLYMGLNLLLFCISFAILGGVLLLAAYQLAEHDPTPKLFDNEGGIIYDEDGSPKKGKPIRPKFYTFMEGGTGTFVVKGNGSEVLKMILAYEGHKSAWVVIQREGRKYGTWKVVAEDSDEGIPDEHHTGPPNTLNRYLRDELGLHYMGIWPLRKRWLGRFVWGEWSEKTDPDRDFHVRNRTEITDFFFVKAFNYAMKLKTEPTLESINIDLEVSIFARVVFPHVALYDNDQYIQRLTHVIMKETRLYVGKKTYVQLREESTERPPSKAGKITEGEPDEEARTSDFSKMVLGLNKIIPGEPDGVLNGIGVEILGGAIFNIDMSAGVARSEELMAATTVSYRQGEIAKGQMKLADAEAYQVRELAKAEEDAIKMLKEKWDRNRKYGAMEEFGKGGSSIFMDTSDDEKPLTKKTATALLMPPERKNRKPDSSEKEEKDES